MAAIALQNSEDSVTGTHIMVAGIAAQVRISPLSLFDYVLTDSSNAQLASMLVFCVLALDFYRTSQKIAPDLFTPKTNVCPSVALLLVQTTHDLLDTANVPRNRHRQFLDFGSMYL